ncbi:MAG: hypothetical protein KAU38_07965 [Desulfobacterales bacterium]|nr:hypothetical protein [Desulfobacterales bacterium]
MNRLANAYSITRVHAHYKQVVVYQVMLYRFPIHQFSFNKDGLTIWNYGEVPRRSTAAWFLLIIDMVQCSHIQIRIVQRETTRSFVMAGKPTHEELEQKVKELEKGRPCPQRG